MTIRIMILLILLCWADMLPAQKSSTYSDYLEINPAIRSRIYKTEYGKADQIDGAVRYIYQEKYNNGLLSPESIAGEYLQAQGSRFGISSVQQDLRLTRQLRSPAGYHLMYLQQIQGIPVYNSVVTITIDNQGTVSFVSSMYRSHLVVQNTQARITASDALQISREYLHCDQTNTGKPGIERMIFPVEYNIGHLVYRIRLVVLKPRGDWELLVDANTGTVWQARNLLRFQTAVDGEGLIWDPDPLTRAGVYYGPPYVDNNDANVPVLNAQRGQIVLKDLKFENGKYYLDGPYVKLEDIDTSVLDVFPALNTADGFNFTRQQQEFEDVMVYYNIDRAGRYLVDLGFTIDSLLAFHADPHGFYNIDNSYYSPFENNCVFGEGGVDDAEDADVLWHEYTHAIMQNIQPWMTYEGETAAIEEAAKGVLPDH